MCKENTKNERMSFFNCLTKEQKLLLFCEVVDRINLSIEEGKTARGALYEIFQFDHSVHYVANETGFASLYEKLSKDDMDKNEYAIKVLELYGIIETKAGLKEKINNLYQDN